MGFIQASASFRGRQQEVLSADNPIPERHVVIETLRRAAPFLGLKAPVIATLDAMLSCLPPKRNHNTVFASNATLAFRRNGISDRTLRRHAAILVEAGLMQRRDSANGKRFTRFSRMEGTALRFGFDLGPLFERFQEIATLATRAAEEQEQIAYQRAKLRAIAGQRLASDPEDQYANHVLRILRRKLTLEACTTLLATLETCPDQGKETVDNACSETPIMSANDGQNVRHHHKSNKELNDKVQDEAIEKTSEPTSQISIPKIISACPEAASFSQSEIRSMKDVVAHAQVLAPMIGVDRRSYTTAQHHLGAVKTALTIWAMLQFHGRIQNCGAYFQSLTTGRKSAGFDPVRLIHRLAGKSALAG